MATFASIGLSQPAASTITMSLRTVTHDLGGSTLHSEVMALGDPDSSNAVAAVTNAAPNSTRFGLNVRIVGGPSTVTDFAVRALLPSTVGDNRVTVYQSTLGDLRATAYQSTYGDLVVRAAQSSAADLLMEPRLSTVNDDSSAYLPVRLTNGSSFLSLGGDYTDGSTTSTLAGPALTYSNSSNDTMRMVGVAQPLPVQLRSGTLSLLSTTVVVTSTHSTHRYELISSAASVRHKVFAYFVGSTHTNPSSATFQSSGLANNAGSDKWTVNFGSGSSGMTGANLAVTPPAFLFATAVNEPLTIRVEGGSSATSTVVVRVSISYITEA